MPAVTFSLAVVMLALGVAVSIALGALDDIDRDLGDRNAISSMSVMAIIFWLMALQAALWIVLGMQMAGAAQ